MEQPDDESSNVTPEEQQQYDMVMTAARGIMFGAQGSKVVLQKLEQGKDDIASTIGHTAAMVISSVKGGIEQKGHEVPGDILFHAGMEVVADLVQVAEAGKLMDEADEKKVTEEAVFEGLRVFGEAQIKSGKVTPEDQAAAAADLKAAGIEPQDQPQNTQPQGVIGSAMGGANGMG